MKLDDFCLFLLLVKFGFFTVYANCTVNTAKSICGNPGVPWRIPWALSLVWNIFNLILTEPILEVGKLEHRFSLNTIKFGSFNSRISRQTFKLHTTHALSIISHCFTLKAFSVLWVIQRMFRNSDSNTWCFDQWSWEHTLHSNKKLCYKNAFNKFQGKKKFL